MTKPTQLRSCRSKSCGRQPNTDSITPTPNAKAAPLKDRRGRSPAHVEGLPPHVNNAEKQRGLESSKQVSPKSGNKRSEIEESNISNETCNDVSHLQVPGMLLDQTGTISTSPEVSDNMAIDLESPNSVQTHLEITKEDPGKALLLVLSELRDIKSQMVKLHQLESTTATLVGQLATNTSKMGELVSTVAQNKSSIQELSQDFHSMKVKVESHSSQLVDLQGLKEEFTDTTEKTVTKMNELIDTQRDQVDSFNSGAKQLQKEWKREVMVEVDRKFEDLENRRRFQSLKDQAFRNRFNLVLVGLPEESEKSTSQIVKDFFSDVLQAPKVKVHSSQRLGTQSASPNTYNRPILVRFGNWPDRNVIWKKRANIPDNKEKKIRIQADLPKDLREGIPTLYQVAEAASKLEGFIKPRVYDYQLELNGKVFQISDLENLPLQIRPSTLAETKSDTHLAFFSRHSKFSNHHPSVFTINGQTFATMEQFLATRRAELSGKEDLIKRAQEVQDPVQAKHILNALHGDHQQEWDQKLGETAMEGLRAKFTQNRPLLDHLCSTGKLILGEASTNARWGIGMDINNKEVLDQSKWSKEGNLLGRSLMSLRAEFLKKKKKKT